MRRISMFTGFAVLAAIVVSPAAQAHTSPSPRSVNLHVQRAVGALHDFKASIRSGNDVAARGALKRNRRQTGAATREAESVNGTAAAKALGKVGRLQARNIGTYVDAFPQAPAALQLDLTGLIGVATEACAHAADTIESVSQYLPEANKAQLEAAANAVRAACEAGLPELPTSVDVDGLTPSFLGMLDGLLGDCHSAVQRWTGFVGGTLEKVTGMIPIQVPALGNLGGMLEQMLGLADSACALLGGIGPVADKPGTGLLSGLFGGGGQLGSLLGGFGFGNLFGGSVPAP